VTIPPGIQPAEVDLAVTALLIRAGIHGEAVPSYDPERMGRVIARAVRKAVTARGLA
jgi:hypothetical protein